jgi:quercetin dioxygenase-like cupin family protein
MKGNTSLIGGKMNIFKLSETDKEPQGEPLFTGRVTIQRVIGPDLSDKFLINHTNFDEGVRNKFHSHSTAQILIVTEGKGKVETEKEQIIIVPGDIIFIPAGEKHRHGAAEGCTFSHLYVTSPDSKTTRYENQNPTDNKGK